MGTFCLRRFPGVSVMLMCTITGIDVAWTSAGRSTIGFANARSGRLQPSHMRGAHVRQRRTLSHAENPSRRLSADVAPWEDSLPYFPSPYNATAPGALPDTPDFFLGFATAAYQVEGATGVGGRGPSVWDTFAKTSGKVNKNDSGDVADDFYHRYRDDIKIMAGLGVENFRMSIAWPRVFPDGVGTVPNQQALDFYNDVVDALLEAGITPHVTLFHWDLPQALQDKYGGWEGRQVVDDFAAYAAVVFKSLGDKVTWWTTFNEPWTFCFLGYGVGVHAPGISGEKQASPWMCTYHVLLAHAAAVKAFREHVPGGRISLNINGDWSQPLTNSPQDKEAAERHMEFQLAIFGDPLYRGDWPKSVKQRVPLLPAFTPEESAAVKGSTDYYAMNYYTAKFVHYAPGNHGGEGQGITDCNETQINYKTGQQIGPKSDSPWLRVVPWSLRSMINWIYKRWEPSEIVITENGVSVPGESDLPVLKAVNDTFRVNFYKGYVQAAQEAQVLDKIPLTGYFAWSLMDNYEWADGYNKRFGVVYVDYTDDLKRYVKASAKWLANKFGTV